MADAWIKGGYLCHQSSISHGSHEIPCRKLVVIVSSTVKEKVRNALTFLFLSLQNDRKRVQNAGRMSSVAVVEDASPAAVCAAASATAAVSTALAFADGTIDPRKHIYALLNVT